MASTLLVTSGSLLLTGISPRGNYFEVLPELIFFCLGGSIGMPALNIAAFAGTRPGEEGLASGLINTSMCVGFPLGLAVLLTIAGALGSGAIGAVDPSASAAASIVLGFRYALFSAAILGALGVLVALRMKDPPRGPPELHSENGNGATATGL